MLRHFNFQITQLTRAAPAAHGGATGQQLQNWGWSQGPSCHFVFRQLNNRSCEGMASQVPSTRLPALGGFPGLLVWISPTQQITAADLQKVTTSHFLNFFPMIFLANLLLWQDRKRLSLPPFEAQLQNEPPAQLEHLFPETGSPSLPVLTPCSTSTSAPTWPCSPKLSWKPYIT